MTLVIFIVLTLNLCVTAFAFHKIRQIHVTTYRLDMSTANTQLEVHRLFSQFQAYHDLVALLQLPKPLPPLRGWAASPDFLLIIASYALTSKPKVVLECSSGASTIVLARCCELNMAGHVYSLEHDARYAEQTRRQLAYQGLEAWVTILDAPLVNYQSIKVRRWYSLERLNLEDQSIDMMVVDGPPSSTAEHARYPALPLLKNKLGHPCAIFVDDANRSEETQTLSMWMSEFPNFHQSMIQAEKGCAKLERA